MRTHTKWTLLGAAVVIVIGSLLGVLLMRHKDVESNSDCRAARAMIDYNKSQNQLFTNAFEPDQDREPSVADYRKWADQIHMYSTQIKDPNLSPHANGLADEANQFVSLVEQARADRSVPDDPSEPPPWARSYADLGNQFHDNLAALNDACPAK